MNNKDRDNFGGVEPKGAACLDGLINGTSENVQSEVCEEYRRSADAEDGDNNGNPLRSREDRTATQRDILLLHRAPYFGGAEKRVLDWLTGIDYSKHSVRLTHTEDVFSERIRALRLPVVCTPLEIELRGGFWKVFFSAFSYLRRMGPDQIVLIDSYFHAWPLAVVLAACLVARGSVYMTEHTPAPEPPPKSSAVHFGFLPGLGLGWRIFMWQLRCRALLSRRVIAVSEHLKEWMVQQYHYPDKKVVVAYHGVDTCQFCSPTPEHRKTLRTSLGIPESAIVIASTARLHREKRVDRLIEAFAALLPTHPNLWLLVAGDGPEKAQLLQRAASAGVLERTRFMGWLADVSPILQVSDIYVLSSDFEGFGIALLEAMASELTCIVTNTFGPRELIAEGQNGFLVDPTDVGVREGLLRALSLNQAERGILGRNARQSVVFNFPIREGIRRGLAALNIAGCDGTRDGF